MNNDWPSAMANEANECRRSEAQTRQIGLLANALPGILQRAVVAVRACSLFSISRQDPDRGARQPAKQFKLRRHTTFGSPAFPRMPPGHVELGPTQQITEEMCIGLSHSKNWLGREDSNLRMAESKSA